MNVSESLVVTTVRTSGLELTHIYRMCMFPFSTDRSAENPNGPIPLSKTFLKFLPKNSISPAKLSKSTIGRLIEYAYIHDQHSATKPETHKKSV